MAFIPFLNGLGFTYIGAKEFKMEWIKEGLIYEIPWFLGFVFVENESLETLFIALGLLGMLVAIVRSFVVYSKHKDILIDDDEESQFDINKLLSSFWVIFSIIIFLNGIGLIIIGLKRSNRRWIKEGIAFEFLWILAFFAGSSSEFIYNFFIAVALAGLILSIVRTFMIYFEEERMDSSNKSSDTLEDIPISEQEMEDDSGNVINESQVIPQFKDHYNKINELKETFNQKEENITNLIGSRFNKGEMTYDRFMTVINNCHKLFYHQADSASSIIHLAPDYTVRLDESVKGKIYIMESIIDELNHLIEELIIHDGDDESDEDLKELFNNMDDLINSVKDYK